VFIIRLYLEFKYYTDGLNNARDSDERGRMYYDNVFRDTGFSDYLDYLYSLASA